MMLVELQVVVFTVLLSPLMVRSWMENDGKFEYLTFAQTWPPGVCASGKWEHHTCSVKKSVTTWIVHGLWPSVREGQKPAFCNNSAKFDINKLAGMRDDLNTYWPNLYKDKKYESFWEHEWKKHGTCAMSLDATKTELLYFKQGLALNAKYNISRILEAANIVPKKGAKYTSRQFIDAIKKSVVQQEPVLICTAKKLANGATYYLIEQIEIYLPRQDKANGATYYLIEQIEICLDKNFKPIHCYHAATGKLGSHGNMHKYPHISCPKYAYNYPPITYM